MAITYRIHAINYREEQYELFYDLLDGERVIVGNQIKAVGNKKLGEVEIEKIMNTTIIPALEQEEPEQEELYTKEEVEEILREKNYLEVGEVLEDLPTKSIVREII